MEQLTQSLKDGQMQLLEVPFPALSSGQVLVRNHYSIISAGTEGKTVKDARLGYIGKARARKEEVKKVIQSAKTIGITETYRLVMNKLESPSALGYSCAGEIIAIANDVTDFKIGDYVACGGAGAVHAEVVAIAVNLCVKVDKSVALKEAGFATIAAIAMQGVRQADLRLGENCVVIGLGLVGQLTLQLLKASGVNTLGVDIDQNQVALASKLGNLAFNRNTEQLEEIINQFSNGYGVDSVIITAATSSLDPIDFAGLICRRKGKVIVVGAVPTGFSRKSYYMKELDLRMSCSYGPGRYDVEYEEQGIDYPLAYVRWTENRNMQAFVDLLKSKKINIADLITHTFDFKNAQDAYQLIIDKKEPFVGIVLKYDINKSLKKNIELKSNTTAATNTKVGMIGAGSFGQNFLLPALKNKTTLLGVATARSHNAKNVAEKFGFNYSTGNSAEVLNDDSINTIFIATRHDSHAEYVLSALHNSKNVFVEKPLCLKIEELEQIRVAYQNANVQLMVGFNRRFAPITNEALKAINTNIPCSINYRINAGTISPEHWIHHREIGGGRIIGELCHFIDYCAFIANSMIKSVSAVSLKSANNLHDTVAIILEFENGSIANISYYSNGNKSVNKEFIEIYNGGVIVQIDDFKDLKIHGKSLKSISSSQDKGHKLEVIQFIDCIENGKPAPISFESIYNTTLATFMVIDSMMNNGQKQEINSFQ